MQRQRRARLRRIQNARFEHGLRARKALLVGLEDELHRAVQLRLVRAQKFRRAQQHGRVHIVPAGVHISVFRAEGKVGLLRHLERVHVCAQQHAAPRVFSRDLRDHAAAKSARRIAHLAQALLDKSHCLRQFRSHLRRAVDRPPI